MIEIREKIETSPIAFTTLTLPYDQRQKSRQRVTLVDGKVAGIILKSGTILRHGDFLKSTDGLFFQIRAAEEEVAIASTNDALLLAKACYHLGNRHVPLQIKQDYISFQRDDILEKMVLKLGLKVKHVLASFEPEGGAYKNISNS